MDIASILRKTHGDTIRALVRVLDIHGPGEGGHAERVAVLAVATAERLGLSDVELLDIRRAAALHDVGKVVVDRSLLDKLGKLTDEEMDRLKEHAEGAVKIIASLPWLEPCLPMIRHHHERWDGTGYPDGLAGEAIPIGARVIGVAEAFDCLTTMAGWRSPVTEAEAVEELRRCSGTQFDPRVVDAFAHIQPLVQPIILDRG